MPHLILEYSDNIVEDNDFIDLFTKCHTVLVNKLSTQLSNCKSRAIKHKNFYLSDGNNQNAFIHVNLKIVAGRNVELLQQTGQELLTLIKNHFSESASQLNLQFSLEINELSELYFK